MSVDALTILKEAQKYIGVTGGSQKHKFIVDTYNSVKPLPQSHVAQYDDDWCDIFISFLAIKTNSVDILERECGVERHINKFKQMGIWNEDGTVVPKVGDIITFNWDLNQQPNNGFADHIGIVEKVSNGIIGTIEGNSNNTVRRREYSIGSGYIRGFARPRYNGNSAHTLYSSGELVNSGRKISEENIKQIIKFSKPYGLRPSFLIAQMFAESCWGAPDISTVGSVDNNWSGISEPFKLPSYLGIKMRRGSARPRNEGGYYVHFESLGDYFKAFAYLLSEENGYKVKGAKSIEEYCKGLFKIGGAKGDYAAAGYEKYLNLLVPIYRAIQRQNPGKLERIDNSSELSETNDQSNGNTGDSTNHFKRVLETGTFFPSQAVQVRSTPSQTGEVVASYQSGENFAYDSYVVNEGYVWLSYASYSGSRRYVAWRKVNGEKFGSIDSLNDGHNTGPVNLVKQNGVFYPNQTVNVRNLPNMNSSKVAEYHSGEHFSYDSYVTNDGYIWLSYASYSGERRYVAWRKVGGETYGSIDKPNEANGTKDVKRVQESGVFYPSQTVNVRDFPSSQAPVISQYHKGESISYDSYTVCDGYVWLSYISYSGERRYVAWRLSGGEKFGKIV